MKAARVDRFQQSACKGCQAWSPEVFQTCVLMDQACSCRLPVSDSCLIICEKLRWELISKAKLFLPMLPVSSLVSYISLFNGTESRIALWTKTPGKELQRLLGHSKFSSYFWVVGCQWVKWFGSCSEVWVTKFTGRLLCVAF